MTRRLLYWITDRLPCRIISEDDALAEGSDGPRPDSWHPDAAQIGPNSYRQGFQELWQSIHGPDSWDANPWVWVISYKRVVR